MRELMRDVVRRQRQARERTAFPQRKVDLARGSARDGRGWSESAHRSYRLVYEVDEGIVWILVLIHSARQWPPAGG